MIFAMTRKESPKAQAAANTINTLDNRSLKVMSDIYFPFEIYLNKLKNAGRKP
jgi:hypothetical protein